ncbi:non-ribosomal peptide synthetase [Actinomadura chibensis]|uniref:Non-ribosomal peptide synthetase n=1 Tax=Actinomadura chibensis TaxID=392828 RepID=A0A5D0NEE6_9ACTN|nr:non-ribosomal peptide synthetase [Actinomadura chibensis]TYB42788.1 non-ribosomal peptide synthetase [Actinomadura chibensis]
MSVETPPLSGLPLPARFEEQAARTPGAPAVAHGDVRLGYAELEARANRLAHRLIRRGAGPGRLVAVMLDRSPDLVVALLAVLKSGAGYVPIAADDPAGRVRHILADSAASLLVAADGTEAAVEVVPVRDAADGPATPPTDADRTRPLDAADTAYVIYTSGSTGAPKGVVIEHRALGRYLEHAVTAYPAVAGRTLLHSSVSFDMAVTSLYAPLLTGGTVVLADLRAAAAGEESLPSALRPTFLKVTPSHLALLRELPESYAPTELLVVGGEALLGPALDRWRADHPDVTVVNEYGPTEATVGCCVHTVHPGDAAPAGAVPIGTAVEGTRLYVLDERMRPAREGELYIGGAQLARGYLGRPDLTRAKFVHDVTRGRLYRTGDLVRATPGGVLEFLGRLDDQVKINGYRVEPGEIAAAITGGGLAANAAVVAAGGGNDRLVAYVVPAAGFEAGRLRAHLAARLPEYMIPAAFVPVAELPLTANGKLDRDALPEPSAGSSEGSSAAARSPEEEALCRLFADLTGAATVGIDDDFVALGGTSFAAARLVSRARRDGLSITLADVLRKRTVRAILGGRDG